ncbi:hypothetical protein COT78_02595 [Candidatus Berkelbacteria bacterium CG10_big_fil_rev_8_21_14_0_10_43_13]|uniref:Uncharacterized protein n=1 Tax=Candidatus Berkelbacteria bacterium CG10_big_fil_rev_8_21_14_0_10_43_13 TaxID=1974514 RepID=A0A2H0W6D6_9BACT|nr:MAG: hypothetical protein COT78_02595 [Candidatus Berkelbacteria bacterium CG10_big_fil_rev_8_21_14_0_10_43_13]
MTLMRNLFFLLAISVFAVASLVISIFNYNPYITTTGSLLGFYLSFLISLTGIGALALYYAKIKLSKNETVYLYFWASIRQAFFLSLAATVLLYLQSLRILDWLIGISVVTVSVLLELFFESKRHL